MAGSTGPTSLLAVLEHDGHAGRGAGAVVRAEQSAQLPSYMTAFIALLVVVAVAACQSLVDTQVAVAVVEPR